MYGCKNIVQESVNNIGLLNSININKSENHIELYGG